MRYGLNKQDGVELRKTEDAFQLNTTLGYRKRTRFPTNFLLLELNFNTPIHCGYSYPNKEFLFQTFFGLYFL
jgi:hypothetical protein